MKRTFGAGISARLFGLGLVLVAPAAVLLVLDGRAERDRARAEIAESLRQDAMTLAGSYTAAVEEARRFVAALALAPQIRTMSEDGCALIQDVGQIDRRYLVVALVHPEGRYHCQTFSPEAPSVDLADRFWFREALAGETGVQLIRRGRLTARPSIAIGQPVVSDDGTVIGVLGAGVRLDVDRPGAGSLALPGGRIAEFVTTDGEVLVRRPAATDAIDRYPVPAEVPGVATIEVDGTRVLVAFARVEPLSELLAAVRVSESAAFAGLAEAERRNLLLLAVLSVLWFAFAGVGARRLVAAPLLEVARTARVLGTGRLSARSGLNRGPTEVVQVGQALDEMAAALEQRERDLEEARRALEERAERTAHQEKLEALGHLTGGVAHDFNNLLTVIRGNLEMVERHGLSEQDLWHMEEIDRAAIRAAQLTQRLLAFGRRQPLWPVRLELNAVLSDMVTLFKRTLGEGITLRIDLTETPLECEVDAGELEAAVLNVVLNARDAMSGSGRLTVRTHRAQLTVDEHPDLKPGSYAVLKIGDDGAGMSEEVARRAIEPFFTTKPRGRGTGLGLSGVFGFAAQSGGALSIDSEPGRGTEVSLYLPTVDP